MAATTTAKTMPAGRAGAALRPPGLLLLPVRSELLEIGDDIVDVLILRQPGKDHLGPRNLGARVLQIFLQGRLVPGDARILVGIAVAVVRIGPGLAADDAVQHRPDRVLGAFADLMAGPALEKHFFAGRSVASSARRSRRARQRSRNNHADPESLHRAHP